jgi:hypothetical protein
VPQQAAPYFEGAAGDVEARGVQGLDLVSGQCVDGGQGDDEATERRRRLVEQPHKEVGGDGLGDALPTSASWLNLVERWFAELTCRKLRRSAHRSVLDLERDIRGWINEWNNNPKPFVWTKTADEILETLASYCTRITGSGHEGRLATGVSHAWH